MAEPTVAAGFVRGLVDVAEARGADRAALLARSGIKHADLDDQDRRIPLAAYAALMRAAKEMTGDPALALHYGETVDIRQLSIVGLMGEGCETVMEGFALLNRFAPLAIDLDMGGADRFGMVRRGGRLWMVDHRPDPNDFPELTESGFARMVASGRVLGAERALNEVHFTHREPPYRAEYDRIFRAPISFGCEWNAVQIDESVMSRPLRMQPRYVFDILSRHAEKLLAELESARTMAGRVESLLLPALHTGGATIGAVAARLGLSRQTLYRRLKAEGLTFERVLDGLRHKLALRYLRGDKVSVDQTAWLLGYSDRAAFARAFKRWTGASPGAMRG